MSTVLNSVNSYSAVLPPSQMVFLPLPPFPSCFAINDSPIAEMADIGVKVVLLDRLNQKWKQNHLQNPCNESKNQGKMFFYFWHCLVASEMKDREILK